MKKKRILIADDHIAIRVGVKQILLSKLPGLEFGEASNVSEAIRLFEKQWDLVILDINLPGRNGFEVMDFINRQKLKTRVLIFSIHSPDQFAEQAFRKGASGFLTKTTADRELVKAVNMILMGRKYIPQSVAEMLAGKLENQENKDNVEPYKRLSTREMETFMLLADGKGITEIADYLSLSISTVNTYRTRVLKKMGLENNSQIIKYAMREGLVD